MRFDIDAELQKTFEKAVRPYEPIDSPNGDSLRTAEDWQKLQAIQKATEERVVAATERYYEDYDARVADVRKRLIDEAGRPIHDMPGPVGKDRFNKDAINRIAHQEVQNAREQVIDGIEDDGRRQVAALQREARDRDRHLGLAKDDFNKVRDRRDGVDRRAPTRSR